MRTCHDHGEDVCGVPRGLIELGAVGGEDRMLYVGAFGDQDHELLAEDKGPSFPPVLRIDENAICRSRGPEKPRVGPPADS